MPERKLEEMVADVEDLLEAEGVHAALSYLNSRAPHRFTGIYRLQAPVLHNVRLFDRKNPGLEVGADVPMRETYCSVVARDGQPFAVSDASEDARTREHPARDGTLSYAGVPLRDETGATWGTLCHFDVVPHANPENEIRLLEAVASRIRAALQAEGNAADAEPPPAGG